MAFYVLQDWEEQFQLKSFNTDYPRFAPPQKKKKMREKKPHKAFEQVTTWSASNVAHSDILQLTF